MPSTPKFWHNSINKPRNKRITAAGYVIEQGSLSLHSVIEQKGKHITPESEIIFDELDIKEAEAGGFEDQFDFSLSMGLALLRDINRKVAITITIETSDEDSAVQLAPIVFKAFRNALAGG